MDRPFFPNIPMGRYHRSHPGIVLRDVAFGSPAKPKFANQKEIFPTQTGFTVIRRLGLLLACCFSLWLALMGFSWFIWPNHRTLSLVCSGTAAGLCILPTLLTMAWSCWGLRQNPQQQLVAVMGSMGLRMFFVLGFGLLLANTISLYQENFKTFWFWILIFYLTTLALEVSIVVMGQQKQMSSVGEKQSAVVNEPSQQ